jgi:hypothetical protein
VNILTTPLGEKFAGGVYLYHTADEAQVIVLPCDFEADMYQTHQSGVGIREIVDIAATFWPSLYRFGYNKALSAGIVLNSEVLAAPDNMQYFFRDFVRLAGPVRFMLSLLFSQGVTPTYDRMAANLAPLRRYLLTTNDALAALPVPEFFREFVDYWACGFTDSPARAYYHVVPMMDKTGAALISTIADATLLTDFDMVASLTTTLDDYIKRARDWASITVLTTDDYRLILDMMMRGFGFKGRPWPVKRTRLDIDAVGLVHQMAVVADFGVGQRWADPDMTATPLIPIYWNSKPSYHATLWRPTVACSLENLNGAPHSVYGALQSQLVASDYASSRWMVYTRTGNASVERVSDGISSANIAAKHIHSLPRTRQVLADVNAHIWEGAGFGFRNEAFMPMESLAQNSLAMLAQAFGLGNPHDLVS